MHIKLYDFGFKWGLFARNNSSKSSINSDDIAHQNPTLSNNGYNYIVIAN